MQDQHADRQIIAITDMPIKLALGVGDAERATPQEVLLSIALTIYEPPHFARHDNLIDTVDYAKLIAFLKDRLPGDGPFRLLETVADTVATRALMLSQRIACVEVNVKKPSVLQGAGLVSVTLRREATHMRREAARLAAPSEGS